MAAATQTSFRGLVLDDLGVVGNPTIEYAKFVADLTSPKGYDGAVLSNFKRDYTTVKFDLTLDGTHTECANKLNVLVAALAEGEGALVLPGQDGTHFDAVPNMTITHDLRGFDGLKVPLTFVVPEGCALSDTKSVTVTPDTSTLVETWVTLGGFLPVYLKVSVTKPYGADVASVGVSRGSGILHTLSMGSGYGAAITGTCSYDSRTMIAMYNGSTRMAVYGAFGALDQGSYRIWSSVEEGGGQLVIEWQEAHVW